MREPPVLPLPHPKGLPSILILAWIAYCSEEKARGKVGHCPSVDDGKKTGKAEQEASILFIQQLFRFSSESQASDQLKRLRDTSSAGGPWIVVTRKSSGARGNFYALGPSALQNEASWVKLGKAFFGPSGSLTKYLSRPIFAGTSHGLGKPACLALAVIESFGPISESNLVATLKGFLDQKTIRKNVQVLKSLELVLEDDDELIAPRNTNERLRHLEIISGGVGRTRLTDKIIGRKQLNHQVQLLGGPLLSRIKSSLRKEPCYYCSTNPGPDGGDVEHFPPKCWGGSDKYSLLLPICRSCNGAHGQILRRAPRATMPSVPKGPLFFPGSAEEAAWWFAEFFCLRAVSYAILLNEGRVQEAFEEVSRFFPTWLALKSGSPIVNSISGEVGSAILPNEVDLQFVVGRELGGIPDAVKFTARHGKGRRGAR